jgi:hypothetical protein
MAQSRSLIEAQITQNLNKDFAQISLKLIYQSNPHHTDNSGYCSCHCCYFESFNGTCSPTLVAPPTQVTSRSNCTVDLCRQLHKQCELPKSGGYRVDAKFDSAASLLRPPQFNLALTMPIVTFLYVVMTKHIFN